MPKPTKGPRLGSGPSHERLILRTLAEQLFEHGKITTTEAKAKRLRPLAQGTCPCRWPQGRRHQSMERFALNAQETT